MILLRQGFGGSILQNDISYSTQRGIDPAKLQRSEEG